MRWQSNRRGLPVVPSDSGAMIALFARRITDGIKLPVLLEKPVGPQVPDLSFGRGRLCRLVKMVKIRFGWPNPSRYFFRFG
jgi:hypothetical protein